ncbi:MAG: hypothetical protein K8T89_15725 [Planctomycetes bacterium]|nr:hypothetical protein [Planctomycetota bacterium]
MAADPIGKQVWLIQCTSLPNLSSRVKKLRGLIVMADLLRAGIRCEAWGWYRRGDRWQVKRVSIEPGTLQPIDVEPRRRRGKKPVQNGLFD